MNNNYIGLKLIGAQGQTIEIISFFEKFNMFQAKETSKNGVETNPLLKSEDIETLINNQQKYINSEKKMNAIKKEIEMEELKEQEEYSFCYGYTDELSHLQKANVLKVLNKEVKFKNKWIQRKHLIKELIDQGYLVKVAPVSNGKTIKDTSIIHKGDTWHIITKTEYKFALYLLSQKELAS